MSNIQKISIALPPEMVSHIKEAVEGGAYSSASEVIREALRDWKEKQARKAIAVKELRDNHDPHLNPPSIFQSYPSLWRFIQRWVECDKR